jgi:large subunit ribosomal protein L17
MRHNKKFNHLGRTSAHRKAMLANMASSLIAHKRITTTVAKAKALRTYVEPLITKAKDDSTHSRRVVFSYLKDKHAVSELFREVADKVGDRPGGYTRILKTGNRLGDNADMCIIELVDFNETMLAAQDEGAKTKKRRSRRGGSKKSTSDATAVEAAVAEEAPVEDKTEEIVSDAEVVEEEEKAEDTAKEEVKAEASGDKEAKAEATDEADIKDEASEEKGSEEESK